MIVVCLVVVIFACILLLCGKLSFGSKLGSPSSEDEKKSKRNGEEWYKQLVFYVLLVGLVVQLLKKYVFQPWGGSVLFSELN